MPKYSPKSCSGFTLVEIAIVLVIIGLVLGMVLGLVQKMSGITDTENRKLVRTQLNTLDTALANFVAQYKRLPCPAIGTLASGVANAGMENISLVGPFVPPVPPKGTCSPSDQRTGVVPWVTLGLTERDATDPWNGRITYRVFPPLAMQAQAVPLSPILPVTPPYGLMDMTACDPSIGAVGASVAITAPACGGLFTAATGCTQCASAAACSTATIGNCVAPASFLANKGLDVWNGVGGFVARQNNRAAGTGAAYVIISHGPTGRGAYNSNGGATQPGSFAAYGPNEGQNRNFNPVVIPGLQATAYRDAQVNDIQNAGAHFDDYLSHPTIMSVLNKANLGPRAH